MASNKTQIINKNKKELISLDVEIDDDNQNIPENEEDEEEEANGGVNKNYISSQVCLKMNENKVDKEVILRRIRHRRRVHKVKSAVQALFSSPFSTTATTSLNHRVSVQPPPKWVDDNFAAP